jgi:hypothetical protein
MDGTLIATTPATARPRSSSKETSDPATTKAFFLNGANDTLAVWLNYIGHIAQNEGANGRVFAAEPDTMAALRRIASDPIPDLIALAAPVKNKLSEKYDWMLDEPLMNAEYASRKLDVDGTRALVQTLLGLGKVMSD